MRPVRADNDWIRRQNLNLVLNIIRQHQPVSRAKASRIAGLSRSTVSQIVSHLIDAGVVAEAGMGGSTGGRQPILLHIAPGSRLICAVHVDDVGIMRGRIEDLTGNVLGTASGSVSGTASLVSSLAQMIGDLQCGKDSELILVVLALPGVVSAQGTILSAVNLGWKDVDVVAPLQSKLGVTVLSQNATGLAGYGEWDARRSGASTLLYVRVDWAVGASMVTENQLYGGLRGSACEIGHMVVDPNGWLCKCGRRGCLETLASRPGVGRRLRMLKDAGSLSRVDLTDDAVFEWVVRNEDNPVVSRVLIDIAADMASAITNVLNLLGPDLVVVESMLCASDLFWEELSRIVFAQALPFPSGKPELARALLAEGSVLNGATAYARHYFYEQAGLCRGLLQLHEGLQE